MKNFLDEKLFAANELQEVVYEHAAKQRLLISFHLILLMVANDHQFQSLTEAGWVAIL
jgi:hypothetical protein